MTASTTARTVTACHRSPAQRRDGTRRTVADCPANGDRPERWRTRPADRHRRGQHTTAQARRRGGLSGGSWARTVTACPFLSAGKSPRRTTARQIVRRWWRACLSAHGTVSGARLPDRSPAPPRPAAHNPANGGAAHGRGFARSCRRLVDRDGRPAQRHGGTVAACACRLMARRHGCRQSGAPSGRSPAPRQTERGAPSGGRFGA